MTFASCLSANSHFKQEISPMTDKTPVDEPDKPRTLEEAAEALGVPYHVVQRTARHGLVPTYRLGTTHPYVTLRDFLELMKRSAKR